MKKIILAALCGAAAPFSAIAQAPAVPPVAAPAAAPAIADADPALWVVKDADTTIYMFGTFHLLDGRQDWFNDEVKTAFDASGELVLEAILPEDQAAMLPLVQKYAVDMAAPLSGKLTPATKAKYEAAMADLGVPAAAFEVFEPWFVAMTMTTLGAGKLGMTGEHGPETILTRAAKAAGKPVGELEGLEFQLKLFDAMPEADQIVMLEQTIDSVAALGSNLRPMVDAWSTGDNETLARLMDEGLKDNAALNELLFVKRNATWTQWVETRLDTPGTVFMAVGAGHLAGKDGVPAMLKARGIETARVAN